MAGLSKDYAVIWLESQCHDDPNSDTGRMWCQDDAWGTCDCGERHRPTKYIRADLTGGKQKETG